MDIRALRAFLAVVREENISRAAETLHITQPSLSRQISQLEEDIGTTLFIRGRRLSLTDAGVLLRRRAEELVELMDKVEREMEAQSEVGGIISIGSGGLSASHVLPQVMQSFRKQNPKVGFAFYTNSADHVKERLDRGLLDFGLLLEPIDITKYDFIRMQEKERWGLLLHAENSLATQASITADDLQGIPLITTDRSALQKEIANWLGDSYDKLDIFATYNIITNVAMLVSNGVASALTIEGAVNLFEGNHLVFRPLFPELAMTSVLAWKKFQPFFSTAGKFLEHFKSMQKMHI